MTEPNATAANSGLTDNVAGALAYVTIVPAIIFLVMEPYNKNPFVKFHAWQNIFLCVGCIGVWICNMVLALIPVLGWILAPLIALVLFLGILVLWILCVVKAYQGQKFMIPFIGAFAEKQANA